MKKLSLLVVFILSAVHISISAAEQPPVQNVTLVSNDGKSLIVPIDVAQLSQTIKNIIGDIGTEEPIPLPQITGKTLANLQLLMQFAANLDRTPPVEKIQQISAQITVILSHADIKIWQNLIRIVDYLDIAVLKTPLADSLIKKIYDQHQGDKDLIEAVVLSLVISNTWKSRLAERWYLNFGNQNNYILPDLDYGFSVNLLAAYNKLPAIKEPGELGILDLNGLRINNLAGLSLIPNAKAIEMLWLDDNRLTTIPANIFDGLPNVKDLQLGNNQITILPSAVFSNLANLGILNLSDNMLEELPQDIFDNTTHIVSINLSNNRLKEISLKLFNREKYPEINYINLSKNPLDQAFKAKLEPFRNTNEYLVVY